MLRQLLLNQIIPRYLASTGRLVLHASAAMMAIIYCAFSLDPSDRQMILHKFRNIWRAISERLGVYRLRYPRVHDRLPEVRAAVIMPTRP